MFGILSGVWVEYPKLSSDSSKLEGVAERLQNTLQPPADASRGLGCRV